MLAKNRTAPNPDTTISLLAVEQHGVVTRAQLLAAGLTSDVVRLRVTRCQLTPVYRGVFRVGPIAAPRAREMAACLACGPDAFIAAMTAARLWNLLPATPAAADDIDVIVRGCIRRHAGIRVRRSTSLRKDEVTRLGGIPITTPARTIVDLAAVASPRQLEQAVAEAFALRLSTRAELKKTVLRTRGRRGQALLHMWLERDPARTRSEAEERLLALIRKARLPQPQLNVRVDEFVVDFLWRSHRLVVEVDGYAFHAAARAFENDRRRDLALTSAGYRVVRVTWQQITSEPDVVIVQLAQALVRQA